MSDSSSLDATLADLEGTLLLAEARLGTNVEGSEALVRDLLRDLGASDTESWSAGPEPIRVISHFACTGGSLISKCISAMPNVQLLSEVEPFAHAYAPDVGPRFAPTDLIKRVTQATRPVCEELTTGLFGDAIESIHRHCERVGYRLVLREHSHTRYCRRVLPQALPSMRQLLVRRHRVLAVTSVRHPVSSFVALRRQNWVHFRPATIGEYVKRYERFLDDSATLPIFRYEDLVDDPSGELVRLCEALELRYSPSAVDDFAHFAMTGDSGRTGRTISPRAAREIDAETAAQIETHEETLGRLCKRLGYDELVPS